MPSRSEHNFDDDDEYRTEDNENVEDEERREDEGDEAQEEEETELRSTTQSRKRRAIASLPSAPVAKKRGRGRPKGSGNKPKAVPKDPTALGRKTAKDKKLSKAKLKSMSELRRAQMAALTYEVMIRRSHLLGWKRMPAQMLPTLTRVGLERMNAQSGIMTPRRSETYVQWTSAVMIPNSFYGSTVFPCVSGLHLIFYPLAEVSAMYRQRMTVRWSSGAKSSAESSRTSFLTAYGMVTLMLWKVPSTRFRESPTDLLRAELQVSTALLQTSIHELHKDIRDNRSPDIIHCQLSNLMMKIADVAAMRVKSGYNKRWHKTKENHDGYEVYGVTIADLGIIKEAIERSTGVSPETSFDAYKAIRPIPKDILDTVQFRGLMRRAWLHEKRLVDIDKGRNGRSGTQAARFAVALPALENSRRDEFEAEQDGVNGEIRSEGGEEVSEASNTGEESSLDEGDDFGDGGHGVDLVIRASGHEEHHYSYEPDQPLQSVESPPDSASVKPDITEHQSLLYNSFEIYARYSAKLEMTDNDKPKKSQKDLQNKDKGKDDDKQLTSRAES
ncbi:uncharacterized protein FSUBG_13488 [Fusarium subglutinans]|uniref:Uncharacterized protein n=1 Tax=Gibberella subglutinans TaxID=42677 RepID=A0A8H5KT36_GIBSU|nr:uncharacterized protein FSUBG_13488 [Fusarium subglutinans]KAF5580049.1 hypothetical protein FSUBG_13488 [Fusarium subglutinans]